MRISPTQQVGCSGSVLVFLLSLFFTPNLLAVTKNWTSGSGNWSPGNWSPAGVPAATDPTRIVHTDGVPRTVTLNTNTPSLGLVAIDLTGSGTAANTLSIPNNNSLTVGGMIVGGHNGIAYTNGRGALTQADGTVTLSSGLDLSVGGGTGSNGTYTLNGGNLIANQSEYVGLFGTGTFHQSGGTNLINPGAIGSFGVGVFAGSNGTYNLSGGLLDSRKSQYIGDQGIGVFNHTGGTNRLFGLSHDLYLGFSAGGNGTYNISGGRLEMLALSDLVVGNNGTGTLNISGTGEVSASNVIVGTGSTLSIQGGKLRLDSFSPNFAYVLSYGSGAIQFSGIRTLTSDLTIGSFFGNGNPVIPVNKELIVENTARITNNSAVLVNGGKLESLGLFEVGGATGTGSLGILSGGSAKALDFAIGTNGSGGIVNCPASVETGILPGSG